MKRFSLLALIMLMIGGFFSSVQSKTYETTIPNGMKNVVLYIYVGEANDYGEMKGKWYYAFNRHEQVNMQCRGPRGEECLLWSWLVGEYKVQYSNPNDITQCYQELEEYIRKNHPEDLDIDEACKNIKKGIEEANPSNPDAGKDVNPSTVTRTIKIISL